jgi:hypothetical protein
MKNFKVVYNVRKSDRDICLHRTKAGAINCQKIRGGRIVKEEADREIYKLIEN